MKTHQLNTLSKKSALTPLAGSPVDAVPIIKALTDEVNSILGVISGEQLVPFSPGALGIFPYYWQNPGTLQFNTTTYKWIQAALRPGAAPVQLDQSFTNHFIGALGSVEYKLSSADEEKLTKAKNNSVNQQMAFLNAWKSAFGSIPAGKPIDDIIFTIGNTWAKPAVTFADMQSTGNLQKLLNNAPPSGETILPYLSSYLDALGDGMHLENEIAMNRHYLATALTAAQNSDASNGGLPTDDGQIQPAYAVSTPLADILNGLQSSSAAKISMQITRTSESEVTIHMQGQTSFTMPIGDFFDLSVDASASYFSDTIATSSNKVSIQMDFTGLTLVNYGPVTFDMPTERYWYWTKPIQDAISNGDQEVSGFKFSPVRNKTDFSSNGPFGYLTGVAISNYPSITITVESAYYESIKTTIKQTVSVGLSFLGIPLGGGSESTYKQTASSDDSKSTVTITLAPPPPKVEGTVEDQRGWILGVQTLFPVAG
jgi:hypothetical protein